MRSVCISVLCFSMLLVMAAPASAVMLGQVDDFQSGVQGWERGATSTPGPAGAGDQFLRINPADSTGGRLVTFTTAQWAGDYVAEGVTAIHLSARNLGEQAIQLRASIGDDLDGPQFGGTWFASTNPVTLEPGSGWVPVELSLEAADLTQVQGTASAAAVRAGVVTLRILHSAQPSARGDVTSSVLGLDDITAVPEPQLPLLGGAALLTLGALVAGSGLGALPKRGTRGD